MIRSLSQGDLAAELETRRGRPVSQQLISDIEAKETIDDDDLLKQIAEILKVDTDVLKNLDWDAAINILANSITATSHDYSNSFNLPIYHQSTIHQHYNPLEKLIELFEKEKAELKAEIERLKGKK